MTDKRVAIVTGGSRGIGAAIAKHIARNGVHVVAAARGAEKLAAVVEEIKAAGGSAEPLELDLSNVKAIPDAVEKICEAHGRLDILVNNAGITKDGLFLRMDDEDFDTVINTNLKSAFVICRTAARYLMRSKSGGRIMNIGSVSGVVGNAGQANYAASKAGLIGLSKDDRQRTGRQRRYRQRGGPGLHPDGHDRRAARYDQSQGEGTDPASAVRPAGRDRGGGRVPVQRSRQLRDRPSDLRGRRNGHVGHWRGRGWLALPAPPAIVCDSPGRGPWAFIR